jgi:hypothetical protein
VNSCGSGNSIRCVFLRIYHIYLLSLNSALPLWLVVHVILFAQIWKCVVHTAVQQSQLTFPSPSLVTLYTIARMSRYPTHLSPNITPTKSGKAQKSRARREPSGVFSLFQPQQIQQFKEAFSLIDQDSDGLIGERDLKDTFASLGAHDKAESGKIHIAY